MPRFSLQPVALVTQLTEIVGRISGAKRDILGFARDAGELLLTVPPGERAAVAAAAGITGRRTRFVYVEIAQNWERVQHAASLREALKIIKGERRPGPNVPLPFESRCVVTRHATTGWCEDDT